MGVDWTQRYHKHMASLHKQFKAAKYPLVLSSPCPLKYLREHTHRLRELLDILKAYISSLLKLFDHLGDLAHGKE